MLPGEVYRCDATGWAVVALAAKRPDGHDGEAIESGHYRLAGSQLADGWGRSSHRNTMTGRRELLSRLGRGKEISYHESCC
jgi:hypothetical protein